MYIYLVTAVLGFIRDYSKTKNVNIIKFMRSPLIILIIQQILKLYDINNSILYSLILERWFFLIFKTYLSVRNNDYYVKKEKYKKKNKKN